jgi:hypothetical protein
MSAKRLSETKLVTWDPRSSDLLTRHIASLMKILTIGDNGQVSTTETFTLSVLLKILAENVELHGVSRLEVKRGLIQRAAFTRLRKYKQQSVYMFRRAVAAEVRGYLARPVEKYWVLLPLHLPQDQLGGGKINLASGSQASVQRLGLRSKAVRSSKIPGSPHGPARINKDSNARQILASPSSLRRKRCAGGSCRSRQAL